MSRANPSFPWETALLVSGAALTGGLLAYFLAKPSAPAPQLASSPSVLRTGLFEPMTGNLVGGPGNMAWWADGTQGASFQKGQEVYATAVLSGNQYTVQGVVTGHTGTYWHVKVTGTSYPGMTSGHVVQIPSSALHVANQGTT